MMIRWPDSRAMKEYTENPYDWEVLLRDYYRLVRGIDVRWVQDTSYGHWRPTLAVTREISGVLCIQRVHMPSSEFMQSEMDAFGLSVSRQDGAFVVSGPDGAPLARGPYVSRAIMQAAVKRARQERE